MRFKIYIFFLLFFLSGLSVFAQNYQPFQFIENKGQWDSRVRFKGEVPGGAFYLHSNGFTVLQNNAGDWARIQELVHGHDFHDSKTGVRNEAVTLRSHAYNVEFINASPTARVVADKPLITYNNYFIGNDPAKWASDCKIYQGVTIENIYPNIDVRYYSNNGQMKYDLLVKPGGDVSKIVLKYNGVDGLEILNKELVVKTSVGNIKELSPYTYQYTEKGKRDINTKYVVKGNTLQFDVKDYDAQSTLVIDPTMIFASFSGSQAEVWGFTATYGSDGSFFGGGIVFNMGFPVSVGAFQTTWSGGEGSVGVDIGIIKLSPDGSTRIYATYIGGDKNEQPHSLIADAQGNLILAGRSNSGSNYPTRGIGLIGKGGSNDIVVTKLNSTGTALIGSLRIGGSDDDGVNINTNRSPSSLQYNYGDDGRSEVIVDGSGNVYVASSTQSISNDPLLRFPVTPGAFQTIPGGLQDGVVLRLDPNISNLVFSSYLGGSANDAAYVLSLNPTNGDLYVAGGTESSNFPGVSGSVINNTNQGGIDGFVSIINGNSLTRSTYLGTSSYDQVFGVQFDRKGFPYVMGQTTGSWPIQNAPFNQPGGKQFIAKLAVDLSAFIYSTVFGTGSAVPNISPVAFLVDRCENVYVSGWGGQVNPSFSSAGTRGLSTVNALQPSTDGKDFYFFVLKRDATSQLYGDFFGQNGGLADHVDGGTSRFDANGVIYQAICANCGDAPKPIYPTTPGAWSTANNSPRCDLAMVKLDLDLAGIRSAIQSSINGVPRDTAGCVPLTVDFRDTIESGLTYEWNFGDGSPQITTTTPNTSHQYLSIGTYRVMLVAIDPTSCNIRDTSYLNIRVGDLKATPDFISAKLDPCEQLSYQFTNTSIAPPGRPFTPTSFVWDFGDGARVTAGTGSITHQFTAPGSYKVRLLLVDSGYCNAPDSLEKLLNVAAIVKAKFVTPPNSCVPYSAVFKNTSEGGQQFLWNFGDGTTSTDFSPTHLYNSAGTFVVKLRVIDSATCNKIDSAFASITIYAGPNAQFSILSPQPPPLNTAIIFSNSSSSDAIRFKWLFGDGDSLLTTTRADISHEFNATKIYNTCLIAFNANGCVDTFCLPVEVIVVPALDVPNAFTPSTGDVNSKIFVRGFAIGKMKFIIWNRWGQKVFETEDRRTGWDGKYKGVIQPMDAYAYTLEVEFTDGTKATKKGDITLIR